MQVSFGNIVTKTLPLIAVLVLCSCGPFVPVTNLKDVPQEQLNQASKVKVYMLDGNNEAPSGEVIGQVEAYSCKNMAFDPPPSKGNALMQLRLKALQMGANAVTDVTFDQSGTDAWGTNCWQSIQASGMALKTKQNLNSKKAK